jgi:hypothetical protein
MSPRPLRPGNEKNDLKIFFITNTFNKKKIKNPIAIIMSGPGLANHLMVVWPPQIL